MNGFVITPDNMKSIAMGQRYVWPFLSVFCHSIKHDWNTPVSTLPRAIVNVAFMLNCSARG